MFNVRTLLLSFFVFGTGLLMQQCRIKDIEIDEKQPSYNFFAYKKIIDSKVKILLDEVQASTGYKLSGVPRRLPPQGHKARIYLDVTSSPALMRYTANGEEVRLFGVNYQLPQNSDAMNVMTQDLAQFKELGVGIIRVSLTEPTMMNAQTVTSLLHAFLELADARDIYVHLAFTHPQIHMPTWLNAKNQYSKAIKDHRNIAMIEIPAFEFPLDTNNPEAAVTLAKKHYQTFTHLIRGEGMDNLIAIPMPNISGPHADKFRQALIESQIQVLSFAQKFETPEDLNITANEQTVMYRSKGKAVHQLEERPAHPATFSLPGMAQKWREMGIQTAASLTTESIKEIPKYTTVNPQRLLAFKAAALTFQTTTDEDKKTQALNNADVIKAPWSAISKSKNAMIFRNSTSLIFSGMESQWQPFTDLPKSESLLDVACVGDCPYWRATFSNLDSSNNPGLITLRKTQTEAGLVGYTLKIQPWIQTRGPASVLQDGWVVLSLKPLFPDFQKLNTKVVEHKNPATGRWEKYKINDKDYSGIGTKNPATGWPYIVVQSGSEYRISEKLPEAYTSLPKDKIVQPAQQ